VLGWKQTEVERAHAGQAGGCHGMTVLKAQPRGVIATGRVYRRFQGDCRWIARRLGGEPAPVPPMARRAPWELGGALAVSER